MTPFALDTNTMSCYIRGDGRVAQRLTAVSPKQVGLPAIVVYEIRFGLRRAACDAQLAAFNSMVQATHVLSFDAESADHAAAIRVELEALGTPIGPHDLLIAATARRYQHTLVTHNTREFSRVPGLQLEDWF